MLHRMWTRPLLGVLDVQRDRRSIYKRCSGHKINTPLENDGFLQIRIVGTLAAVTVQAYAFLSTRSLWEQVNERSDAGASLAFPHRYSPAPPSSRDIPSNSSQTLCARPTSAHSLSIVVSVDERFFLGLDYCSHSRLFHGACLHCSSCLSFSPLLSLSFSKS